MDEQIQGNRLAELAESSLDYGKAVFTPFLTPAEVQSALHIAKRMDVEASSFGGFAEAERQMVCFGKNDGASFPIQVIQITWPKQDAPQHRDLLGALLGLGLKRSVLGDIIFGEDQAFLFVDAVVSSFVLQNLNQAGRAKLHLRLPDSLPELLAPMGEEFHTTVISLRLDAIISMGFHLSRSKSEELIHVGLVKKNYQPCTKPDEKIKEGDLISVRGHGRIRINEIGLPNRKGRLPLQVIRFINDKHK